MEMRPHHLWVLQGIIERSGCITQIEVDFPEERQPWRKLYQTLTQNPDSKIVIVASLDYICRRCQHNDGTKCLKYSRLDDVDNEAIMQFGLVYGKKYRARELIRLLK